ncbi:MAG: hypothetical protein WKG07_40430 [Hymenobacter sp.]
MRAVTADSIDRRLAGDVVTWRELRDRGAGRAGAAQRLATNLPRLPHA